MVNLTKLFDSAVGESPKSQLIPGGHWQVECQGAYFKAPTEEGKGGSWGYFWSPVEPLADVDKKALKDLNGHDYTTEEFSHWMFFSTVKDKAAIEEVISLMGVEIPAGTPITVVGEDGVRKINPVVREAIVGGRLIAKLKIGQDRRTKEPQMEVEGYLPLAA